MVRVHVPAWSCHHIEEYGHEARVIPDGDTLVIEGNEQGLLDIAATVLSLAGPGASRAAVELHEWGAGLEEGSLLLAIGRTDSSEGEPVAWNVDFCIPDDWRLIDLSGLGVRMGKEDAALWGKADSLIAFGNLLVSFGLSDDGQVVLEPGRFAPGSCKLIVRKAFSSVVLYSYPLIWRVLNQKEQALGFSSDYIIGTDGRPLLSSRAVRVLEGVLEGCVFEAPNAGDRWTLVETPELDCLQSASDGEMAVLREALSSSVGLFRIRGLEDELYANDYFVDRAMEGRLLGFRFRPSWTSGNNPYPKVLTRPSHQPADLVPEPSTVEVRDVN